MRCLACELAAVAGSALLLAGSLHGEWRHYAGDAGATRYSPLKQIHRGNVAGLRVAWTFRTGDMRDRPRTTIECTPIVAGEVMYLTSPQVKAMAVDAASGREIWRFDPFAGEEEDRAKGVNRGVTYWEGGDDRRILFVADAKLYALDARTGRPIPSFGKEGIVDLRQDLDRAIGRLTYNVTTPGVIYRDLIILGSTMGEGPRPAAPGHIRAYDVRTGARRWIFHTIPLPGEHGHETWEDGSWKTAGAANNWGGMSVDEKRGLVFVSLGSPAFDFYGGQRLGDNLYGNAVVALKAATGERVWHFQTVRHDVWDYDLPVMPVLVTATHQGRRIDAVAQVTKTGHLFLFDRVSGRPLFPIEERAIPKSPVPGERTAATQPIPLKPPPFARQQFTEADVTDISPESRAYVLEQLKKLRHGRIYEPPSLEGTVVLPGFHGGALWGGAAFDPASGRLFVPTNNVPNVLTLVPSRPGSGYPYDITGYKKFEDQFGYPAVKPPWGVLTALDLNKGEIAWQVPVGEHAELTARGVRGTGTEMIGGAIVTAGGLILLGATRDEKFRALDKDSGKLLWETQLEAGGYATPSTYQVRGRQFVVIAAGGGGKLNTKPGDSFVAFALP